MTADRTNHDYVGLSSAEYEDLRRHDELFPDHGRACQCMDMFVLTMRQWLEREFGAASVNPRFDLVLYRAVVQRGAGPQMRHPSLRTSDGIEPT